MASSTRPNAKLPNQSSIVIDAAYPVERASLLQTVCDAYVELGRLAVIAALLGLTSFIVTYVIKNQSLTDTRASAEPLKHDIQRAM